MRSLFQHKKNMREHIFLATALLVLGLFLLFPVNGTASQNHGSRDPETSGELIVKYRSDPGTASINKSLKKMQAQMITADDDLNVHLIRLQDEDSLDEAMAELEKDANVAYVEPNYIYRISGEDDPDDLYYSLQWGLDAIDVPDAWEELGDSSRRVTVAVVDTGVDYSHPDLADDPDLPVWVDTTHDKDFVNGNTAGNDADGAMDDNGHGTHVAGIIGAVTNNDLGVAGVAGTFPVTILPIKVLDKDGVGTVFDVALGIRAAADQGAAVINLSLGGPGYSRTLAEAVSYAQGKGCLVVAAAGNEDDVVDYFYPASLPGVLTVGAVEEDNFEKADFSNYGESLDVVAPGVHVLSTVPEKVYGMEDVEVLGDLGDEGCYAYFSGTSMAAPFVSGVAALIKMAHPDENAGEIAARIQETARDLGEEGWDPDYGYGLVQAEDALSADELPELDTITFISPDGGSRLWGEIPLQVQVAYPDEVGAVRFYLDEIDENHLLGEVIKDPEEDGQLFYNFTWDTTKAPGGEPLADGSYTLIAQAVDSGENSLGQGSLAVEVKNQVQSGLQFQVINPDGTPGREALVSIWYRNQEDGPPDYWYESVYQGQTDSNGTLRVPGSWATDLNDYVVLVASGQEDEEGNWVPVYYVRRLEAPQMMVIDGSQAQPVTFEAHSGESTEPMAGGEIWCYYQDENGIPLNLPDLIGYLGDEGTMNAWMDPGSYGFYALNAPDGENAYYLHQEARIPDQSTVNFDLTNTSRVQVSVTGQSDWWGWLYLDDYFGIPVTGGQEIIITPGTYPLWLDLCVVKPEGENGPETWEYWFAPENGFESENQWTFSRGESHPITVGENMQLSLTLEQTELVPGDSLYGDTTYQDNSGLFLWEVVKYEGDLSDERESSVSGRLPNGAGAQEAVTYRWDRETRAWEIVSYADDEPTEISPVLQIEKDNDGEWGTQEIECPSFTGFSYYLDPTVYVSGNYQALLSLDAGPLGSIQSRPESGNFSLGDFSPSDEVILEITAPGRESAEGAWVSVYVWTEADEWEEAWYEDLNDEGILHLPIGAGIERDDQVLIVVASSDEDSLQEPFFLYENVGMIGQRDSLEIDGTRARQVEITASASDDGIANMNILNTVFLPAGEGDNLWSITNYLGGTDEDGKLKVWLDPGIYSISGYSYSMDPDPDENTAAFYLNTPLVEVPSRSENGPEEFSILLNGDDTATITPQLTGEISSLALLPVNNAVPYSPFFELYQGDKLYLTPGTYRIATLAFREDPDGVWAYFEEMPGWSWAEDGQALDSGDEETFRFSTDFSFDLSLRENEVDKGDYLQGDVTIRDVVYGNRIADVGVSPRWYHEDGIYLSFSPEGKLLVQNERGKMTAESYDVIAPFLSIFHGEDRIYHEKNADHYLTASYLVPSDAATGSYTAQMALQIGPEGVITDTEAFEVTAGGSSGGGGGGGGGSNDAPIAVDKEDVSKYFADHPDAEALTVEAKNKKNPSVTITLDGLKLLQDKEKDLVIAGQNLAIADLLSALDLDEILDSAGTDQDVEVKITFGQQSGEENARLVLSDGMHFVAGLNLEITVLVKGNEEGTVSTFRSPISITLQLTPEQLQGCNVDLLGVYYYNEETDEMEYVGGTYDAASGKIRFETPHWSKYLVLEYKKAFTDFPAGHWAQNDVEVLVARHIVTGLSDTKFGPEKSISRAEFAALLVRALGVTADSGQEEIFRDVPAEAWFADDVAAAYQAGLIQGSSGDTFAPQSTITREEMAVMIVRALKYLEKMPEDPEMNADETLQSFADRTQVSSWALDDMAFAVTSGIMEGRTADTLAPGGQASRAESAVILKRFMQEAGLL